MTDSQTVVKALTEVDPGFLALTHTLFGDSVDGAAVWDYLYGADGISKMNPAPPDLSTSSGRTKVMARPKPQGTAATEKQTAAKPATAAPATKNTAPKSAMTIKEPKKSSVMKADEDVTEALRHAVVSGVDPQVIEEIVKSKKKASKKVLRAVKTEAKEAVQRAAGAAKGKVGPALGGATAGGVGGYAVAEASEPRPTITYEIQPRKGTTTYYKDQDGDDELTWAGTFSKVDDEKRLAFGWASVIEVNGEPVVDRQADVIDWEELEKAAYDYVTNSRKGGNMHKRTWGEGGDEPLHVADVVESFVVTPEKIEKMGLPETTPIGWWLGMRINDDESWEQVKKGERAGFSIHGRGRRRVLEDA